MKMRLESLRKQTYNTRRLEAGDVFEADRKFARVLIAQKRAREVAADPGNSPPVQVEPQVPQPPAPASPQIPAPDDLAELRTEYERVVGKRPFNGWDAETLRSRMAAHQSGEGGGSEGND